MKSDGKIRKVLMVDDEPDIAVTIEAVLEESGFFEVDLSCITPPILRVFWVCLFDENKHTKYQIYWYAIVSHELERSTYDSDSTSDIYFIMSNKSHS